MKSETSLANSIKQYIAENNLLDSKDICLAVSGGADSVAMLLIFLELKNEMNLAISVRHFEHGIRGEESIKDAEFVKELCEINSVPFCLGRGNVPQYAKDRGLSLEEAARELRYKFLLECKEDTIATAHNMNDNVETFIFNLVRGTGIQGLCGINTVLERRGKHIIRPLLNTSRARIEEYLKENTQDYKFDKTNSDTEYARNKIRHEILPVFF